MKKLTNFCSAVALLTVVGYSGNALADAAIVVHEGTCFVPGVGANGVVGTGAGGVATGTDYHKVENDNIVHLICHADVTNLFGKAVNEKGINCGISLPSGGFVSTNDTSYTASKSGNAKLKCSYVK